MDGGAQSVSATDKNQLAVFAECEANKNSIQYNLSAYFSFSRRDMDALCLKGAMRRVSDLHGAFHTRIVRRRDVPEDSQIDGREVYQVMAEKPLTVGFTQLERDFAGDAQARAHYQAQIRSFDLFNDRLYRIEIVETTGQLYLFFDMHHIISDGYNLRILAEDITRCLYREPVFAERLTFSEYVHPQVRGGVCACG